MTDVEIVEDHSTPGAWRVEDHSSGELTIFAGPDARHRAVTYAQYQYYYRDEP